MGNVCPGVSHSATEHEFSMTESPKSTETHTVKISNDCLMRMMV